MQGHNTSLNVIKKVINQCFRLPQVKPMIGSPFTVGLSLPVRLDYQYQFLEQSEIDEGRMILETSERNIVFRSFENKKCQGVLQYLVRD